METEIDRDWSKDGEKKGKGTWSEREQAAVMVECINIQLRCHAPHITKSSQFYSIIGLVYHHLSVSWNMRGLKGHNDELLTLP